MSIFNFSATETASTKSSLELHDHHLPNFHEYTKNFVSAFFNKSAETAESTPPDMATQQ